MRERQKAVNKDMGKSRKRLQAVAQHCWLEIDFFFCYEQTVLFQSRLLQENKFVRIPRKKIRRKTRSVCFFESAGSPKC